MQTMKQAAAEFLAGKRVAVTGVSRNSKDHGSNVVYQRLRQRGYQVFAVNPNADQVEGDTCYHDLASIPGGVDWVVIGTRPQTAEATMRDCADLGIKRVWMHRGPGAGSVSPAAAEYGRQHGITVIDGGCPCMFNPTADPGHKAMRFVFTLTGNVPRRVLRHGLHDCHHQVIPPAYRDVRPHEHQSRQGRRRPVQALGRSRWPCCQRAPAGCGPCLAGCCTLTCRGGGPALARRLANTRCGCPLASYDELDRPGTLRRHQVTDPGARNQRAWMWNLGATAEGRTR